MKNIGNGVSIILGLILVGAIFFFQSKLEQKDAENNQLKEQYNQLVKDTNNKLQEANKLHNQLVEEANKKLLEANQPEVPVIVAFRDAFFSSGSVARISNQSGRSIAVTVTISRPLSGSAKNYEMVINSGASKEIGEQEGWAFVSGDTVTIEEAGHKSRSYTMG